MGQIGLMHHLESSSMEQGSHGCCLAGMQAFLTDFLASLGQFLFISCLKQHGLPVPFKNGLSPPSQPSGCAEQEQRGVGMPSMLEGLWISAVWVSLGFGVPKVQLLSTEQLLDLPLMGLAAGTARLSPELPRERSCNSVLLDIS